MTDKKKDEFYSEDGKIEYCFDGLGIRREVGPSFKDIPLGFKVLFTPICDACKNKYREEIDLIYATTMKRKCKVKGEIPSEILHDQVCYCENFIPDKDSIRYELVMQEIEEYKKENNIK